MKIKIGLFFGGRSVEHEVSVISALQAFNNFDKNKYDVIPIYITRDSEFYTGEAAGDIASYKSIPALLQKCTQIIPVRVGDRVQLIQYKKGKPAKKYYDYIDLAFPVVHGSNVEDGALQGFFRTLLLPFAGCDVDASAIGMDKYAQKLVFKAAGVPVLDALRFDISQARDDIIRRCEAELGFPLIVKPLNLGSSVGIGLASNAEELARRVGEAFSFAGAIIVETAVQNLREINCAVLGDHEQAKASECEEPVTGDDILSYEDKYVAAGKGSKGMSGAKRLLPAPISDELRESIQAYAVTAFKALGCSGVARIDFLMDGKTNRIWANEINTTPGSLAFYLWEAAGVKYPQLLDEMVSLALKKERERGALSTAIETGILANFDGGSLRGTKGMTK